MSAVSFNTQGQRSTVFAKPADTNAATVYTAPAGGKGSTLLGIAICAGTSATATVMINDGTTDWNLLTAKSVSANTTETYEFGNPVLKPGYTLKVQSGTGNTLTYIATLAEVTRDT